MNAPALTAGSPAQTLTVREKILLAATGLGDTFTRSALAVAAWRRFPESFSLDAPEPLPNSNAVYAKLAGAESVVARGWLAYVEKNTYAVTKIGREVAVRLGGPAVPPRTRRPKPPAASPTPEAPPEPAAPPPVISRVDAAILWHLTRAQAVMRNARGGVAITSRDAEDFWRAGGGADRTGDLLARACADGAVHGEGAAPPDRGRLMQIRTLHLVLVNRFAAPAAEGAPTWAPTWAPT